jgi:hypothetical protein
MYTRAIARLALLACALAWVPAALAQTNEDAHAVAEKFAKEPEQSEAAKREAARKAEDARKREAELKADKAREEAAARRAAEALKADKEKADKARRAKAGIPEGTKPTAERRKADEDEMLARAKREAEEMQAAEEARILAEQADAMRRAKAELEASQAAERERAKADVQRRQPTGRGKDADIAEQERAKLEALAREAADAQQAEATTHAAEERAKTEAAAREAERVQRAEAEARAKAEADRLAQVEADRLAAEWTRRAVANRQAVHKLARVRDIRVARLAAQAERADTERRLADAQRKAEDERRAAAPENRKPDVAEAPRPEQRSVERTLGSARETAGTGEEIDPRTLRLPKVGEREPLRPEPRTPETQQRASRDIDLPDLRPDLRTDSGVPGERRVTVLLVMAPGNYGIRRGGPKVADPIMCTVAGCYVSTGPGTPARFLPGRQATGFGNTIGGRAGACRQTLGCIFRGIDIAEREGYLQPVDLHILKHDRRRPQLIDRDSDCRVDDGRLQCRRGIYAEDYAMWVIPERMATAAGAAMLERALDEGLAAPRSADLHPRPRW